MYAVIVTGGKQYQVSKGDVIYVEKLAVEEGKKVVFDNVLLIGGGKSPKVGSPNIKGATVEGKVVKHGKNKKITVFTYRPKKNSKRKLGHRQQFTKVEITAINEKKTDGAAEKKPAAKAETKTVKKPETTAKKTTEKK